MRGEADVVIVGGGIVGCATAYYAAKRGLRVALVDKGAFGFEQSTRNWGWVHQQVRYPHLIPLAVYSRLLWEGLEQELGAELDWVRGGNLSLAYSDADRAAFERYREHAKAAGLESEVLGRVETQERMPALSGSWIGALHVPTDGQANPHSVTRAFASAAQSRGAELVPRCAAEAIEVEAGEVVGVASERGTIRARRVVVAAGTWSRRILRPLALALPQSAVRATVVRTTPSAPVTDITVWGRDIAFRQDARGRFILAGGGQAIYDVGLDALRDLRGFARLAWQNRGRIKLRVGAPLLRDLAALWPRRRRHRWSRVRAIEPPPDPGAPEQNLRRFLQLFPQLDEELAVEKIWAGVIDTTPDQAPVLDALETPRGLIVATGFSGHGFALGPGAGRIASALVAGDAPELDLEPYRFARFAEGDVPSLPAFHPR